MGEEICRTAARRLARGELVAFPTETVWGLAADSASQAAVDRLCEWKRRRGQPISVLVGAAGDLAELPLIVDRRARALAEAFWPGALTLVLPVDPSVPVPAGAEGPGRRFAAGIAREDGAVGVRCSPHPLARALARAARAAGCGFPTATSCNRSGEPPARTFEEARRMCAASSAQESAPFVLAPGPGNDAAAEGLASSVIDLCGAQPRLLRAGALPRSEIERVLDGIGEVLVVAAAP